jgi:uncharacterized protein YjbI with pentapeptide repeats
MSTPIGNIIDISKAYILDSDFESGLFENSNWLSGYHINYNNDVNITKDSSIGKYYNLESITSSSTLIAKTTYDINHEEAGESCLSVGNIVYLNAIDYDDVGKITSFTLSTPGSSYITANGVTAIGGYGTGAKFDITALSGGVISATLSEVGLGYKSGDILTLNGGSNNSYVIITGVTGSIIRLPDTYKITQRFGNELYLKEVVATGSSIISTLKEGGVYYTSDAQNRYGYIYKAKINKSKIRSGLFKRSYFKQCLIENSTFNIVDKDLTNIDNVKNLLVYESLFSNTSNILSKALYLNSYIINGSDSYRNGIVSNSIWVGATFTNGVFRQGRWVDGTFLKGTFYNSKTFNKTSTINNLYYDVENATNYLKDGKTSGKIHNDRYSWQNGTFVDGDFYKSDWENGTFKNGKFHFSNFYNGYIENAIIGDDSLSYNKTNILGGSISYATVENANLFAEDVSYYGLSGSSIDWYNGVFDNGVFGCDLDYINYFRATWHKGIFNGGEFKTNANWLTGIFNGGKFTSAYGWTFSPTYDSISNNQKEYGWEDGEFNGGEFGTAETATNSVWYKGEFNNGTFKGRLWNNGILSGGEFKGSATYSAVGGGGNINASNFTDSFSQSFYGLWNAGIVSNVRDRYKKDEKFIVNIKTGKKTFVTKSMIYMRNALWLSGTFSSSKASMQNCVWLDGSFERGVFDRSSFNPYVKRPGESSKTFNIDDDSCYWENGTLRNSDFNYSIWKQGRFIVGTGYGMIFKDGVCEYMNAFNIFWEAGLWRNGNWYGSPFEYSGTISDPFEQAILNRGIYWSGTQSCHIWNIFENTSVKSSTPIISATSSTITERIKEYVSPVVLLQFNP